MGDGALFLALVARGALKMDHSCGGELFLSNFQNMTFFKVVKNHILGKIRGKSFAYIHVKIMC